MVCELRILQQYVAVERCNLHTSACFWLTVYFFNPVMYVHYFSSRPWSSESSEMSVWVNDNGILVQWISLA